MRLKVKDVKPTRLALLAKQGLTCGLCKLPLDEADAVLDHDHKTGLIRASLHRGCNSLLGQVERGARYGVKDLFAFAGGLAAYMELHASDQTGLTHPSHKSADEKKLAAKARRRRRHLVETGSPVSGKK